MNTFTTKFKVGDTVWVCYEQSVFEANVNEVTIRENSIGYNLVPTGGRFRFYRDESEVYTSISEAQKGINQEKIDRLLEQIKKYQKTIEINQGYIATLQSEIKTLQS